MVKEKNSSRSKRGPHTSPKKSYEESEFSYLKSEETSMQQ